VSVITVVHVVDLPVENPWLNGVATFHDRSRFRHAVVSLGPRTTLHDGLERRGVKTHALGATSKRNFPAAVLELWRYFRNERPDIVQTHLFYPSLLGLLAASAAGIPIKIVTRHHSDFTTTFHHPLHREADRLQALWADRVLAASAAVKRDMIRYERVPASKITVARYGYDFSVLRPTLSPEQRRTIRSELVGEDALIVATVARLSPCKGHRYLLHAIPRILEHHPSCRFVLVGSGPLREELGSLAEEMGIAQAVSFLGWRHDAWHIMEAADLVAHPSLHEAFCSVIVEAMALGRPLVTSNIAAAPEQIENGKSGILVPPRDPGALAVAICELLDKPNRAKAMGQEARRRVNEEFNFPKMMPLYESVYEELLSRRFSQ
jgi:glycosyltransferase involved in cell wall biosynthesis